MNGKLDVQRFAVGGLAAAILDSAHALVVTLDIEGRITGFNRACELLSGYKADEMIGTHIWDRLLPQETVEPIQRFFTGLPEGGEILEEHENAWLTRDGRRPIIAWNNSVIRNAAGEIEVIVGIGVDITERKVATDRLARAQRIATVGNWEWTIDTGVEYWSDQFFVNLGLEPGSVTPAVEEFYRHVHPDDRDDIRRKIRNAVEAKQTYSTDFRVIWPDGTERLVHEQAEPILDASGSVTALVGTMQDVTELRETESRLQRLTGSLANAQRMAGVGNWDWDAVTKVEWWSDEIYRLMGLEPAAIKPCYDNFMDRTHPDDREKVERAIKAAQDQLKSYDVTFRLITPDGDQRVVRETGECVLDSLGRLAGLTGAIQDITAQHSAEQALANTAERLEAAMGLAKLGSWEWDPASNLLKNSAETLRICGLEANCAEVDNEFLMAMIPPEEHAGVLEKMNNAVSSLTPYTNEYHIVRPNGDRRMVFEHGQPFRNEATGQIKLVGTIQDITERKQVEEELARTVKRLADAQAAAQIGNWEWDAASDRNWWSEQQFRNYGMEAPADFVPGDYYLEFAHPTDREAAKQAVDHSNETGTPLDMEFRAIGADGVERMLWVYGTTETDADGRVIRAVGTTQDITARKYAEMELLQTAERLNEAQRIGNIGSWLRDLCDNSEKWSDQSYAIYGLEPGEIAVDGNTYLRFVHPDDRERVRLAHERAATEKTPLSVEYRCIDARGVEKVIQATGECRFDETGALVAMAGTIQDITELNRAQRNLALNLKRLDISQEAAAIGSWEWNLATEAVWWSDQQYRNYGAEPGSLQLVIKSFVQHVHPADREAVETAIDATLSDGIAFDREYRVIGLDDVLRVLWGHGVAEHDKDGNLARLIGTTLDITDRKEAEWQLAISANNLKNAQRIAKIGSWERDIATNEVSWSDQNYRIYGLEPGSVQPRADTWLSYVHPDDRGRVKNLETDSIASGQPFEFDFRSLGSDGIERVVLASGEPELDTSGRTVRISGTLQDITEQQRIERALRESESRLRGIFDHAPVGIGLADMRGYLVQVNGAFANFLGYSPDQMLGLNYRDFSRPEHHDEWASQIEQLRSGDAETATMEKLYIRQNGKTVWGNRTLSLIRDEAGNPKYLIVIVEDIDDRKRAEAKLAGATARLEEAHRIALLGHWEWRPDTIRTVWSDQVFRIFGMEPGEIQSTHETFFSKVHADDRERMSNAMARTMETGEPYEIEFRIFRVDGAMRNISERAQRYVDEETGKSSIRGVMQDITERKLAELALRETKERLEKAQQLGQMGSWTWEPTENVIWGSDQYYRIFGLEPGSTIFDEFGFLEYVHPADRDRVGEITRAAVLRNKPFSLEYRIVKPDGAERIVLEQGEPVEGDGSRKMQWRGVLQDVTEHRQAEEAIRISNRYLDLFFKHSLTSFVLMDRDFNFIRVNEAYASADGKEPDFFAGKNHFDIYPSEARSLFEKVRDSGIPFTADAMPFEYAEHPERGVTYWDWTLIPVAGQDGATELMVLSLNNVTERVKAEHALRDSEARLDAFFSKAPVGLAILDSDYRYVKINETLAQMNEASVEAHIGKNPSEVMNPERAGLIEALLRRTLEDGEPVNGEESAVPGPDGTRRYRVYTQFTLSEDRPKPERVGVVVVDITELKNVQKELARLNAELEQRVESRTAELRAAQAELVKSERLATLGQLTATVSHELRNPLGAMRTSMYVIEKKLEDEDQRLRASIDRVNRNITRCDQIIDELLDYTRIRDLDLRQADLDSWLGAVLDEQDTPAGVTVKRKFGAKGVRVPFDDDRLRRAVINIFENACHAATDPHNANDEVRRPVVSVETSLQKNRVQIAISDNGAGIPAEIREKIFEPLFSTKNFGVGLGLPTVRQIMEQHGGGIEIDESCGGGAKFALWLPLAGELESAGK